MGQVRDALRLLFISISDIIIDQGPGKECTDLLKEILTCNQGFFWESAYASGLTMRASVHIFVD